MNRKDPCAKECMPKLRAMRGSSSIGPQDRSHAAQLKLMLRQQAELDVVLMLVAWYVWRERVAWLQTSSWWKQTSGHPQLLLRVLQHWRRAVTWQRQDEIQQQLTSLQDGMDQQSQAQGAQGQALQSLEERGQRVMQQLQEVLQSKDAQMWRRRVFGAWRRCLVGARHRSHCRIRRAWVFESLARPQRQRCGRWVLEAWRWQVQQSHENRSASQLFLKFKLLHQGAWAKEQLHMVLLRWFDCVRPRRHFGARLPWQRAWLLLAAQELAATDHEHLLHQVWHGWRSAWCHRRQETSRLAASSRQEANEAAERKAEACRKLLDIMVKVDLEGHLLMHCVHAWKEVMLREQLDATEGAELSMQSLLKSSSLMDQLTSLTRAIRSSETLERQQQIAQGLCRFQEVWAGCVQRRQQLSESLRHWRRWNAGISLQKSLTRSELQRLRLAELETQVEPMRSLVRESRQFLLSYLCGRCRKWRQEVLQEVFCLWSVTIRLLRDAMQDKVLQLRRKLEADAQGEAMGSMLGALALGDSPEQMQHFLLEAWLRVVEHEKHQREVEALTGTLNSAFVDLCDNTRSCKAVVRTLLDWMHERGGSGIENLRDVLRGWATAVSTSMQRKMAHFRKLQAHSEITKLCESTAEWIDRLRLRQMLKIWQQQTLREILQRHAEEGEKTRKLKARLKKHYRIIELIRGKFTDRAAALALAHVCLGAWSIYSAMENAQKLTNKARQNSIGHRSHGLQMLSNAKDLAGEVLSFALKHSLLGAFGGGDVWPLVKRCFPLWRREAVVPSAKRRLLEQEASNLKITEELRLRTERHQERCSRWAVRQMMRHQQMRCLEEAFYRWCDQKPRWRQRQSHRYHLQLADAVLVKAADPLELVFAAWKRAHAEEKVMKSEEALWHLEGRLARLAGERGLSMLALEERLALEDED